MTQNINELEIWDESDIWSRSTPGCLFCRRSSCFWNQMRTYPVLRNSHGFNRTCTHIRDYSEFAWICYVASDTNWCIQAFGGLARLRGTRWWGQRHQVEDVCHSKAMVAISPLSQFGDVFEVEKSESVPREVNAGAYSWGRASHITVVLPLLSWSRSCASHRSLF